MEKKFFCGQFCERRRDSGKMREKKLSGKLFERELFRAIFWEEWWIKNFLGNFSRENGRQIFSLSNFSRKIRGKTYHKRMISCFILYHVIPSFFAREPRS